MRPSTPRKFTLVDAMVLIAATACALAATRQLLALYHDNVRFPEKWTPGLIWIYCSYVSAILKPLVISWSAAICILRLRKPRPTLRRVFRQPGMAACTAIVVSFSFEFARVVIWIFIRSISIIQLSYTSMLFGILMRLQQDVGGGAVLIAWTILYLSRTARAERSWIDIAGRILGWYYLADSVILGSGSMLLERLP